MVHKMRDLDQGYDYEVLSKKTKTLRKHYLLNPDVGVKGNGGHRYCWIIVAFLVIGWLLYLGFFMYLKSLGFHMFGTTAELGTYEPAALVRIPAELANKNGAYCLDGTVPSYYIRKGKDKGEHSWIIHLQGGGWCWDLLDCYHRSFTDLGSSENLPPQEGFDGIMSPKPDINPDFHDWNTAQINYCDGASFSGNIPYPITYNNKTLYFRGALVLDLVVNYLLQSGGLRSADRIILFGTSAGGTAVVLHIDHIKTLLPDGIPFHGLVGAGLFLDYKNLTNFDHFRICTQRVYNIQQVWGSLNEDCKADQSQDTRWKCFFSEYAAKYVQTPTFYMNSVYDSWQLWFILEMHCHPTQCPKQLSYMTGFHNSFVDFAKRLRNQSNKTGMFISSCYDHSPVFQDKQFTTYEVDGRTPQKAFGDWYFERVPEGSSFYFDCEDSYDCNPTCNWTLDWYKYKTDRMKKSNKCVL